jgi:hypothetical protein
MISSIDWVLPICPNKKKAIIRMVVVLNREAISGEGSAFLFMSYYTIRKAFLSCDNLLKKWPSSQKSGLFFADLPIGLQCFAD